MLRKFQWIGIVFVCGYGGQVSVFGGDGSVSFVVFYQYVGSLIVYVWQVLQKLRGGVEDGLYDGVFDFVVFEYMLYQEIYNVC